MSSAKSGSQGNTRTKSASPKSTRERGSTAQNGRSGETSHLRTLLDALNAANRGEFAVRLADGRGDAQFRSIASAFNSLVAKNQRLSEEMIRVERVVGREGRMTERIDLGDRVDGGWAMSVESINALIGDLVQPTTEVARVISAVAEGDLTQKMALEIDGQQVKGEFLRIGTTVNSMVDQLSSFAAEVTRVAKEVGTDGKLGAQAEVPGVAGTWKHLTDNVNVLAGNLTDQVRNIAKVTTAVANGDLSQKITVDVRGEILELKNTINTMVDQLRSFAGEVTRVAKEVGTEGKLGGQAEVRGASGTWKDLTDNVNSMASNLTGQVRNIAVVTTAVANGDLSTKITVEARGEILELKNTINTMVDQLNSFASEVTRVAREVGTEGQLGGQAEVVGVGGVWKNLTDNVNFMARNLTTQVRGIVKVVTAVANGDVTLKLVGVESKGEIAALGETINDMCDTLGTFADQVSTVAREVGIEGKLGGQAKVPGAMGTWRQLTDNVNQLAGNLTTQVRAISDVATAVTKGDLTQSIDVQAEGEVAQLKDNINQMIINLRETTQKNQEQDWLKTNLAKFSSMMQGQKNLEAVSDMIMSQLTPLVGAHHGAFFMMDTEANAPVLVLTSTYAYRERKGVANRFRLREGLVGQCAHEKRSILLTKVPSNYIQISSGLGEAPPLNIIVLPVLFEGQVKAVLELASFHTFSPIHQLFLDQLTESIGVVLNMITANMRTEELLAQSQTLTQELQSQSKELTVQQHELRRSNTALEKQALELEEKARLLAAQNTKVEEKNREVELARVSLEEKAEQLALASKYKSEFLANMSHELRTPLNSLLILARLLAENGEQNLSDKQVEFAQTIYTSGGDLLSLINEILDLSKVEAGKMEVEPRTISLDQLRDFVERSFRPVADQKGLELQIELSSDVPRTMRTDPQRLQQVLKNLLSNAFKFTEKGSVRLRIGRPKPGTTFFRESLRAPGAAIIELAVTDTGIGIPRDKHQIIFEAFQQADGTTNRRYGGTGLGLSISREITRLLGGEIHIHSDAGTGSTFALFLPERLAGELDVEGHIVDSIPDVNLAALPGPDSHSTVEDDRETISESDRVVLIIEDDVKFARIMVDMARANGFLAVVATRGDTGLALANELLPDAITLDLQLPILDGWTVLDRLKRNPRTRHIPVHVISIMERSQRGAAMGAFAYLEKPISKEALEGAFTHLAGFLDRTIRVLLLVEDDDGERGYLAGLLAGKGDVEVKSVRSAAEALRELESRSYDCMVVDLVLPDFDGIRLVEEVKTQPRFIDLPVVIYTSKVLSDAEEQRLKKYAQSVITKTGLQSIDRLVQDTSLFLHRLDGGAVGRPAAPLPGESVTLEGRAVMVVDDDVRNIFAMVSALEERGLRVFYAENGRTAIDTLATDPEIEAILMDVMMPEMDGYETMRAIRSDARYEALPIIAVTAKALREDRDRCLAAGASDYLPKPVDIDELVLRISKWIGRR